MYCMEGDRNNIRVCCLQVGEGDPCVLRECGGYQQAQVGEVLGYWLLWRNKADVPVRMSWNGCSEVSLGFGGRRETVVLK